jgi:hypothetical protein
MEQPEIHAKVESLIVEHLAKGPAAFDDVYLYVGRNFSSRQKAKTLPDRFYFLAEGRMKSLKRKGLVSYDRKGGKWHLASTVTLNEQAPVLA